MIDIKTFIRTDLQDYTPYTVINKEFHAKLDANENPFNLPQNIKERLAKYFLEEENLNIYPDSNNTELRKELAKKYNLTADNFTCGVGSDQIIDFITKIFLNADDKICILSPTFTIYSLTAKQNHGKVIKIDLDSNFEISTDKILKTIKDENIKILFLCTPNNPSGNSFSKEEITKILKNSDCIIAIDEAYADFTDETVVPLVNDYNNLIVLRTFSKYYGIAGTRVGYAVANTNIIDALNIVRPPYNLSTISQIIALEVLKNNEEYIKQANKINDFKKDFYNKLKNISWIKIYPSDANFFLIDSKKEIINILEKNNVLIKVLPNPSKDYVERIRVSVGSTKDNDLFIKILSEIN